MQQMVFFLGLNTVCCFCHKNEKDEKLIDTDNCFEIFLKANHIMIRLFSSSRKYILYGSHSCCHPLTREVCVQSWIMYFLELHKRYSFWMILQLKKHCRYVSDPLTGYLSLWITQSLILSCSGVFSASEAYPHYAR